MSKLTIKICIKYDIKHHNNTYKPILYITFMESAGKLNSRKNILVIMIFVVTLGLIAYAGTVVALNSKLFVSDSEDTSTTDEATISLNTESPASDTNQKDSTNSLADETSSKTSRSFGGSSSKKIRSTGENTINPPANGTNPVNPVANGTNVTSYFLFGTDDASAIFWGTFNNNTQTLNGEVMWYGNPSMRRIGTGNYSPNNGSAGTLNLHFVDPNNAMDPGLYWAGTFDSNVWTLYLMGNNSTSLSGRVFQAPN